MRAFDRDLIRGGHYGQRSCEPRKQAEHMAAPTQLQTCRKPLPTGSRPHMALLGHLATGKECPLSVRKQKQSHSRLTHIAIAMKRGVYGTPDKQFRNWQASYAPILK